MSRGRRYSGEKQLNYKKVFAVIMAFIVIIMAIFIIKNTVTKAKQTNNLISVSYFKLYQDNKWGIIDSTGNIVIDPMYQEMIVIIDNKKDVFLCTYDVDQETGIYSTKVVNNKNENIFTEYDKVEALENFDKNGNLWYENDVLKVQKNGKYGLINLSGNQILGIEYDRIESLKGIKNSILVEKNGLCGLVDNAGNIVVDLKYKEIKSLGETYKEGYITVNQENKYGIVGYNKKQILQNNYDNILHIYSDKYFVTVQGEKQILVNENGENVLESTYESIVQITNSGIIIKKDGKYGLVNYSGETVLEPSYEYLHEINTDVFEAKSSEKNGVVDLQGETKISFEYQSIKYISKANIYVAEDSEYKTTIFDNEFNKKLTGILCEMNTEKGYMKLKIDDEYKYYNFKFEQKNVTDVLISNSLFLSKKNGKYGFVDKNGNIVVDYIYDDAVEQNQYGYSGVKKNGLWGSIDSKGNVVIEPKYDLDENLLIDFIGKWHLGVDINMNYYCEK